MFDAKLVGFVFCRRFSDTAVLCGGRRLPCLNLESSASLLGARRFRLRDALDIDSWLYLDGCKRHTTHAESYLEVFGSKEVLDDLAW